MDALNPTTAVVRQTSPAAGVFSAGSRTSILDLIVTWHRLGIGDAGIRAELRDRYGMGYQILVDLELLAFVRRTRGAAL
jgi:hypothetical protein